MSARYYDRWIFDTEEYQANVVRSQAEADAIRLEKFPPKPKGKRSQNPDAPKTLIVERELNSTESVARGCPWDIRVNDQFVFNESIEHQFRSSVLQIRNRIAYERVKFGRRFSLRSQPEDSQIIVTRIS